MRDRLRRDSESGDVRGDGLAAAGKRSLSERAYASGGGGGASDVAPVQLKTAAPPAAEDPFALHVEHEAAETEGEDDVLANVSEDEYREAVGDEFYEQTRHMSPAERRKALEEEEYRQTVGDDYYEKTKHLSPAERKAFFEEEEYKQTVGDEIYEKTRHLNKAQRKAYLRKMEREMRKEQGGKKKKQKGKKAAPKKAAPAITPTPGPAPATVGNDPGALVS
jgi:hypothetical protein